MIEAHLRMLRTRDEISPAEEKAIRGAVAEIREIGPDKIVVPMGKDLSTSLLLIDGWMARSKRLEDGNRQISQLHIAGDFVDLHGFALKRLDHDVVTMSRCRYAVVPHERLRDITERFPHLTRVYWFSTTLDAAIHREWAVSLGSRPALQRMAHLFCELLVRCEIAGTASDRSFDFPLIQRELGECLGITPVHVNRTLQEMRRRQLIVLEARRVRILDHDALAGVAAFDPAYLYLERKSR